MVSLLILEIDFYMNLGVSNPEEYITFYGMRNWDILMGSLVSGWNLFSF